MNQEEIKIASDFTEEEAARILDEEAALQKTKADLVKLRAEDSDRHNRYADEARRITSEVVNSQRESDKQLLANDEAVSHAIASKSMSSIRQIDKLTDKPYFARIVLLDNSNGKDRKIEYKIGKRAVADANIIDWKNAPLARLYYEYNEGEEYLEWIRETERTGTLVVRNSVKIEDGELTELNCKVGNFSKDKGNWIKGNSGRKNRSFELPSILSLISKDQFDLITSDSQSPVALVGIAGSGKTAVALHRLAWQVSNDDSPTPLVITPSVILSRYVSNSFSELENQNITVKTIQQITLDLKNKLGIQDSQAQSVNNDQENGQLHSYSYLSNLVEEAKNPTSNIKPTNLIHQLILAQLQREKKDRINYSHIYIDEFQDFNLSELVLIGTLIDKPKNLTISGDPQQRTLNFSKTEVTTGVQVSHEGLKALNLILPDNEKINPTNLLSLKVSHRSTKQIMDYADHLLGEQRTADGRAGKPPLLLICDSSEHSISELQLWIDRVSDKFENDPILILTKNLEQSKFLLSALKPHFNDGITSISDAPRNIQSLVLVASIDQVKGLEFPHVCIWGATEKIFPRSKLSRRLLYLAATRAEEHLTLITWGEPASIVPSITSKLHRVYDARMPEEDNSEN